MMGNEKKSIALMAGVVLFIVVSVIIARDIYYSDITDAVLARTADVLK